MCFPADLIVLPSERDVFHAIPLKDPTAQPPFEAMHRLSPLEKKEVDRQVTELLQKGYLEPSSSLYGSPMQKNDGSLRTVIDYRALNKLTVRNSSPLPRIDDLLDSVQGATIFSSLYHQIRICADDVLKTAFQSPSGLYQWRLLALGLFMTAWKVAGALVPALVA